MNKYSINYNIKEIIKNFAAKNNHTQKRYILTGGPGAGKTSIINYLASLGYSTMSESATEIIEHDIKNGIEKPWRAINYHSRVANLNKQKQEKALKQDAPVIFFDRGHLDGITYILLQKRTLYPDVINFVESSMDFFDTTVFFVENLPFCAQGFNRTETLEEALEKAYHLEYNYRELGYKIIKIPVDSIEDRATKIIEIVRKNNRRSDG